MRMRLGFKAATPFATDNFMDQVEKDAMKSAIYHTWYWFNNQDQFFELCMYLTKEQNESIRMSN